MVSQAGVVIYTYDCNGNMTVRNYGAGGVYNLTYDAENQLTAVSGAATATFVYDGDGLSAERQAGNRVKGTVGGVTTPYGGDVYAWNGTMVKYYYAGSTRVAIGYGYTRLWLFGDHICQTSGGRPLAAENHDRPSAAKPSVADFRG